MFGARPDTPNRQAAIREGRHFFGTDHHTHDADLINVFEVFLPQLLLYPNPTDPLNGEAAALLMREPEAYTRKVKDYVSRFATRAALDALSARHRGGGGGAHGDAGASNGQGAGANGTVGARDDSSDDGAEDYVSSDDDGDAADDMDDV